MFSSCCVNLLIYTNIEMSFCKSCRHANYSFAYHGQTGVGFVRVVQPGGGSRWTRRRHQQETVAGDHQGPTPAVVHHVCRLHSAHSVRTFSSDSFLPVFCSSLGIPISLHVWLLSEAIGHCFLARSFLVFFPRCVSTVWRHIGNKTKRKYRRERRRRKKNLKT